MKYDRCQIQGRGGKFTLVLILIVFPVVVNCSYFSSHANPTSYTGMGIARSVPAAITLQSTEPELPRFYLDTSYVPPAGATINVPAGGDLQGAINNAKPGDIINLQAGATYMGNFTLPAKSGGDWIVIRSSAPDSSLPPPGTRITPDYSSVMPKIVTDTDLPALTAEDRAHHYRFIGIEFTMAPSVSRTYSLVSLGESQTKVEDLAHDLIFDRVYIHGRPTATLRRGIALNSASTAVIDSYISDCHEVGADSQAIIGWNGPGPFKIVNNYLEGAGENIMFGGADPSIPNLVPSDIEFRRNHCFKPLSWKIDEPEYAGINWSVKNSFELKNARRIIIEGNVFENNWAESQVGFAIVFTVRNQDGTAPWSTVEDVTFINNIVRHSGSGLSMHGTDDNEPSLPTKRIRVSNNFFVDINGPRWGDAAGRWLQIISGPSDVTIEHNTAFQTGPVAMADVPPPGTGFIFRNNISPNNEFGFFGSAQGTGTVALDFYFPNAIFRRNILIGGDGKEYPADNFFPGTLADVKFENPGAGKYQLQPSSQYKNAGTDGRDIGVDFDVLNAALSGTTKLTNVSSASYRSDFLAPDSIVTGFGSELSSFTGVADSIPLPTNLGGVTVKLIDNLGVEWFCPLFFVSPNQINYLIPAGTAQGFAQVTVMNGSVKAAIGSTFVANIAPALFTADATGQGLPTAVLLRVRSDNTQTFEPVVRFDSSQNKLVAVPIDLGPETDQVFLILYGTAIRHRSALSAVIVNIGGGNSEVLYAGPQNVFVGLDQINVRLSRTLKGRGDVDLSMIVDGISSNSVRLNIL